MKKSTLALAVTLGAIAQQAGAAGFIEDSKATLGLRNSTSTRITVMVLQHPAAAAKTPNGAKASICVSSRVSPKALFSSVLTLLACMACVWTPAAQITVTTAAPLRAALCSRATAIRQSMISPAWV